MKTVFFYSIVLVGLLGIIGSMVFAQAMPGSIQVENKSSSGNGNRIYDVNRDGVINFQDAGLCWVYIEDDVDNEYGNLLYDVNMDGQVNFQDCGLIWVNRD